MIKSGVSELVVLKRHIARRQTTAGRYTSLLTRLGITLAYGIHMLAYGEITETNLLIAVDMNSKTNVHARTSLAHAPISAPETDRLMAEAMAKIGYQGQGTRAGW